MKKRPLANVEWRKYFSPNNITLNWYLKNFGDDFIKQSIELVVTAYKENLSSFVLIEFKNTDIVSIVERSDYLLVLQHLLTLCEQLEKYEICSEIIKYQKSFKKIKKIPTKKTNKLLTINN